MDSTVYTGQIRFKIVTCVQRLVNRTLKFKCKLSYVSTLSVMDANIQLQATVVVIN